MCSLNLIFENETNVKQKQHRLCDRLSRGKKILIILDDIWKELDLNMIGIPIKDSPTSIKLLLTSRLEETLEHKMDCRHNFELKALSKEEAVELFKRIVGCQIEDESLMDFIDREIVEECACLPVYIVPLATRLKTYAPSTWKKALDGLRESNKLGMDKLLEETLKDEEAKKLFLLCGQIGTQIITINDLLVYGMGWGLFQSINTIEEKREKLKTLLENLKSICFLEDYGNDCIKIHDVMSKASFSVASKTQHSLVLRDDKQLQAHLKDGDALEKCKSISLPFVGDISGGLPKNLKCPELNMFLSYNVEGHLFPDSFFNGMTELKVLDISGAHLLVLPPSIQQITKLQTLCLDRCTFVDLSLIGQLKELQVLTLRECTFTLLPKEVGKLSKLRLLDLSRCIRLQLIELGVLKSLTKLEELYLPENYTNWEVKGSNTASLEELTCMSSLASLTICIPNLTRLPHDFPFAKLKRYKIVIMELDTVYSRNEESGGRVESKYSNTEPGVKATNCFVEYDKMGALRIKLDSSNREIFLENWVQTTLHSAQQLELLGWTAYEESITELSKQGFSDLKHIRIQNSPGIQYVFRPKDRLSSGLLESLHLERLINLRMIYQGNLLTNSFIKLKILRIKACYKLQSLFSPSLAKGLSGLEEIELSDCKRLTKIVASNETGHMEGKRGGNNEYEKLTFERLRRLVLSRLPQISSFCAKENIGRGDRDDTSLVAFLDRRQVSFPSLEYLALSELPKLSKISEDKFPVELQGVRILKIKSCENLSNILKSNLQLKNLEALAIESCPITTVFNLEKKSSQGEAFVNNNLAKLIKLKLINLHSLETIWPRNFNIKEGLLVHNLNRLEVSNCHKLNYLFSSSMIKSLQNISQISVDNCKGLKMIFAEENDSQNIGDPIRFLSLIELRISKMDCLTMFASGNRSFDFPCLRKLEICHCSKMSTFVPPVDERKSPMSNNAPEFGDEPPSCIKKLATRACIGTSNALPPRTTKDDDIDKYESFFSTKVNLPSLEKLVLSSLGCFMSIWQSFSPYSSFCKLATIQIKECNSLETLVLVGHGQQDLKVTSFELQLTNAQIMNNSSRNLVLGFPFLIDIEINDCAELKALFPDVIVRTLFELENLHISSCKKMVEVVFTSNEKMMTFNKLCSLKLENLDELKAFSEGPAALYFPFLKELWISGCTKLKSFITSPNAATDPNVESTPLFHDKVMIPNLEMLHIKELKLKGIVHDDIPHRLFCKLKHLEVEACHEISTVLPHFILPNMQSLESLTVENCNSVRVIFEFEGYVFMERKLTSSKPWKLKTLILRDLPQLKQICERKTFLKYFPFNDMEILEVQSCKLLRSIFQVSTAEILEKLQKLSVKDCKSMDQVVKYGQECSTEGTNKIILHQLSFFMLSELPMLSSFCSEHMTEWPSLTKVKIEKCGNVEAFAADSKQHFKPLFFLEKVAFPQMESLEISGMKNMMELWSICEKGIDLGKQSKAFSKLKFLGIGECANLSTVFPSNIVGEFRELEVLGVGGCPLLKEVFQVQDFRRGTDTDDSNSSSNIQFSLRALDLSELPELSHVWNIENGNGVNLTFEELQQIDIRKCDRLKHLVPASIARYMDQLDCVDIEDCKEMEAIVQKEVSSTEDDYGDRRHHQFVPNIKVNFLNLKNLPELKSFIPCKDRSTLIIINCPKAKAPAPRPQEMNNAGSGIITSDEKVDIPSCLIYLETDMEGLQKMQYFDGLYNLRELCIHDIDEAVAKGFLWKFLLQGLHNLEALALLGCPFEELFLLADNEAQKQERELAPYNPKQARAHLQSLRQLSLLNLPGLKRVWREASVMKEILDAVEFLIVGKCPYLKYLFQAPSSFHNLAKITVGDCREMEYLLTSSAARCLSQLIILEVSSCGSMEEIVREDEDGNGGADDMCFPRLKQLKLKSLEKLTSFCSSTSCNVKFPSLEYVSLKNLHKLETFCRGGFTAPLLHDIDAGEEKEHANDVSGVEHADGTDVSGGEHVDDEARRLKKIMEQEW